MFSISKDDYFSIRVLNELQDTTMPLSTSVVCVLLFFSHKVSDTPKALARYPPAEDELGGWYRVHHSVSNPSVWLLPLPI